MTTVKHKKEKRQTNTDLWQSPSLEELAKAQGVDPIFDVSSLFGTWPGETDDGFEEMIHKHRQQDVSERKIYE